MIRRVNETGQPDVLRSRKRVDDFDSEFGNLWGRAYGVAFVVLGDRSEAEDVAQETLARALVRWKKVSAYAEPWVVRVAGNLSIDRIRKQQRARRLPAA